MRFARLYYLYGFWFVGALILFFVLVFKNKRKIMRKFAEDKILTEIACGVDYSRQIIKIIFIIGVFLFGIPALMRPQWGFQWQEIKRRGLDILIAVDCSKSMLAGDVKPNRLERSKLAVRDLIKKITGDRIGLIAFSGTSFLQCPLTMDYEGFLLALNDLSVDTIPRGGTSISAAIKTAMESYEGGQKKYKILIIITDGEDHEGNAVALAEEAKRENVKIFCIGIGTKEGELIQVSDDSGRKTFLKDNSGNVIKSRLNEKLLEEITALTGGMYVRSSGAQFGLDLIYEDRLSKMEKRDIMVEMDKIYYERFQIPLTLALVLLAMEPFVSDRKKINGADNM